jgi:cytochrome oxidase Cu insertion factor (SCO1/SenC/PrrC family)
MSIESTARTGQPARGNGRWILLLIFAVCVLPFFGAYLIYRYAPPDEHVNYGELVTRPLADLELRTLDGGKARLSDYRGKWLLLHVDDARCEARCNEKMYQLRQVRLAQGKNMERVLRVWVIADDAPVDGRMNTDYEGTVMVRGRMADLTPQFPAQTDIRDHVWLVDPLGNLVLRYPPKADASGIRKDLQRLLKVSRIG